LSCSSRSSDGAGHVLDRRHPAQQLLDADLDASGVITQDRELLGVLEQGEHAVGHDVAAGFVAADQDEQALRDD